MNGYSDCGSDTFHRSIIQSIARQNNAGAKKHKNIIKNLEFLEVLLAFLRPSITMQTDAGELTALPTTCNTTQYYYCCRYSN